MIKHLGKLIDLINDLSEWEVERMSSSGEETINEMYKVVHKIIKVEKRRLNERQIKN
tara:strand:+ start:154 stop:324 length:171 start_codon:yes stop_codon:yes gene_type:complete